MPPNSVDTTAPWTALTLPTADSIGAQSSSFTIALVTVSTGIGCLAEIIVKICKPLMRISSTARPTTAAIAIHIFFRAGFIIKDFAMSCISRLGLAREKQTPKSSRDFELPRTPFRCRHSLWLQDVAHQHPTRDGKNQFCQFMRL